MNTHVQPTAGAPSSSGTPQRRSIYDLGLLIDELFERVATVQEDGSRTCRCSDLPAVLKAFEERRQLTLLDDDEKASLENFAHQHPELNVSSEQLTSLLGAMTAQNANAGPPDSPTPARVKPLPTPPPSDAGNASGRGRSSSASSGSSQSSRNSVTLSGTGMLDGPGDYTDMEFPRSFSMPEHIASPPLTPMQTGQERVRTSSDPDKTDTAKSKIPVHIKHTQSTPLSATILARQRSSPLDVQPTDGFRRTRPAPPKSRRVSGDRFGLNSDGYRSRQSSEEPSPRPLSPYEGVLSPSILSLESMMEEQSGSPLSQEYGSRSRQASGTSNTAREVSPAFGQGSPNTQALSPLFPQRSPSLDPTPFHTLPVSPPSAGAYSHDTGDFSLDGTLGPLHSRPVSTVSLGSESAMTEMIQQLQQELARKTQDLEAQRADGYAAVMEKEALLEEVRTELAAKRKEEKELRSKEKINSSQIATLEAQTAKFRDERDKQKAAYQTVRKQYEEQCNESEKLRNTIRAKDEEFRLAEENVQASASDLAKIARERDFLQTTVSRLETELAEARENIEVLEEQRAENLQLRETIDRLRLDLDELRVQAKMVEASKGSSSLSRSASGSDGLPASLSRNLGRELARRLQAANNDEDAGDETEREDGHNAADESYEEEIVTTRRRLKRPFKKPEAQASADPNAPLMVTLDVVDVAIQCVPSPVSKAEMVVQTDAEPEVSPVARRALLARELEVDLTAVEEYIRVKAERARLHASIPDSAPPPYQSSANGWQRRIQPYAPSLVGYIPPDASSAIQYLLSSTSGFLLYTALVYTSGVLSGGTLFPTRHYHHITSADAFAQWAAYNTLDLQHSVRSSWREGLAFWLERIIWKGVSVSRRVPT